MFVRLEQVPLASLLEVGLPEPPRTDWEQCRIDRPPGQQDSQMQPHPRVDVEKDRLASLHDVVQRKGIPVVVESWRQFDRIESGTHVRDDPEDKPDCGPWLSNDHGYVLTCQTQRTHANEVDHPIYHKARFTVSVCMYRNLDVTCGWIGEGDLERQIHERVGQ